MSSKIGRWHRWGGGAPFLTRAVRARFLSLFFFVKKHGLGVAASFVCSFFFFVPHLRHLSLLTLPLESGESFRKAAKQGLKRNYEKENI